MPCIALMQLPTYSSQFNHQGSVRSGLSWSLLACLSFGVRRTWLGSHYAKHSSFFPLRLRWNYGTMLRSRASDAWWLKSVDVKWWDSSDSLVRCRNISFQHHVRQTFRAFRMVGWWWFCAALMHTTSCHRIKVSFSKHRFGIHDETRWN